ncbi:MAG: SHOCT-like domain-containing protein [Betaproteobacteria bacterium]
MIDEKRQILTMVQEGKISVDEGLKLLEALESSAPGHGQAGGTSGGKPARMLRVRVLDVEENTKVNVNLPLSLVKVAMKFIPKHVAAEIKEQDIDLEGILASITDATVGKIVDVDSDTTKVEVYVE